nr:Multidrug resistance protein mexB Multidrug-efflux transporter mexB [Salmonella sp. NCTC 7297]
MANFFYRSPHLCLGAGYPVVSYRALAIFSLPVEQYPDLAPPNVRITANYPGASAQTLEKYP